MTSTETTTKTAADITTSDVIEVSDRFAKYVGMPQIAGVRLPVAEVITYPGESTIGFRLEGVGSIVHANQYAQIPVAS